VRGVFVKMKVAANLFIADTMATLKTAGMFPTIMESQLELLHEIKEALIRADSPSWEEWDAERHNFDLAFKEMFPRILRYSFVLFLYSVVEEEFTALVKAICKQRKIPFQGWEGKKFSLKRCKSTSRHLYAVTLPNDLAWNKLLVLEKVRNCIAHVGGVVEDSKDKEFLKEAVSAGIGITISKHSISKGRLDINPKFCKKSTDAAIEFFTAVFERGGFGPDVPKAAR